MSLIRSGPQRADLRKWNGVAVPAGGFSVRASSSQHGTGSLADTVGGGTISVASVTTTRADAKASIGDGSTGPHANQVRWHLSGATTVSMSRGNTSGATSIGYSLTELL